MTLKQIWYSYEKLIVFVLAVSYLAAVLHFSHDDLFRAAACVGFLCYAIFSGGSRSSLLR